MANRDALWLWVSVESEQFSTVTTAAPCIAMLPGARFCISRTRQHIRAAEKNIEAVADAIALAARVS